MNAGSAPSRPRLLAAMAAGPLVMDAGMGTRLLDFGLALPVDDPCTWSLDRPDDVLDVHLRDVQAGAEALLTNTFGANRIWLDRYGRASDLVPINQGAIFLANHARHRRRDGADRSHFVLGDIGPSGADRPGAAAEQAAILNDPDVDALILETFGLEGALLVLSELRTTAAGPSMPILVSLCRWPDAVEDAALRLVDAGADAIGLNCRPALREALALARRIHRAVGCPLLVRPGVDPADPPEDASPSAFAAAVPALVECNVRLIGGCCGTTEAHVAAIARALASSAHPMTSPPPGAAP